MVTTISSKGQIVIPAEMRELDNIQPGQQFDVERVEPGEYRLKRMTKRRNEGLVEHLLACPAKGWFQPLARKETTDEIRPLKLG